MTTDTPQNQNKELIELISKQRNQGKLKINMVSDLIDNGYDKQKAEELVQTADEIRADDVLTGLGGWLILVGIGIVLSPLKTLGQIVPGYKEMFSNGSFNALTTTGSETYIPYFKELLIGEMVANGLSTAFSIYLIFLFFSKKKSFPKFYIGLLIFSIILIVIEAISINILVPNIPAFDAETIKELRSRLSVLLILIPYMLISERVKNTFTK